MFILRTLFDSARTRGCLLYQTTYSKVLHVVQPLRQPSSSAGEGGIATLETVLSRDGTHISKKDPIRVEDQTEWECTNVS